MRSRPATGTSTWVSARTSTTASPTPTRPSRAWALHTTSSQPAPWPASPTHARWRRRSTRTWFCRAKAAPTPCFLRFSTALPAFPGNAAWLPQRVPRQPAAGHRQKRGLQRRVHLEVHAQRLRLQRARQHAHHVPHRLAQLQDSRLCAARRSPQLPQLQRLLSSCHR